MHTTCKFYNAVSLKGMEMEIDSGIRKMFGTVGGGTHGMFIKSLIKI